MLNRIMYLLISILLVSGNFALATTTSSKLPQTGQTTCWDASGNVITCAGTGQNGELQSGVAWPNPRFVNNSNGTITDKLTGLVWLKDAKCFASQYWETAIASANTLISGKCGLTDGSTAGQWRLPNVKELRSLVNEQQAKPYTWLNSQGFSNVQANDYWSSSTSAFNAVYAWSVSMSVGGMLSYNKTYSYYVWPVRAGQ